ncbi:uncharacterized protein LOC110676718 [Aedes aegypti]|uniref:Uncharacterized protein n=1 Tax=Aedes aegypti TaxID=7159 RepID=A0A6I8U1K9_AEDAE|nr:uncharacterized protein LOC110676718 [Aedes aegypti]
MILNIYIKYKLPQQGVEHLLRMFNVISMGNIFPESFESFRNMFRNDYEMERIYFCQNCQYGYTGTPSAETRCPVTNCNAKEKDFFIAFSLEQQIRETVLKYSEQINNYEKNIIENDICDINRGTLAQATISREDGQFITLSANEDSAAPYKSTTKKPLYPLFLTVNNLPPQLRFDKNNLMLAALWFNTGKPDMALFHKHFIQQTRRLRKGIKIGSEHYKILVLQDCLDSVGRCEVFCSKQFNGTFGCTICLHSGKSINNQIRYPYQRSRLRDDSSTRKLMLEVHNSETQKPMLGIKGLSVLTGVPDFDIIRGLPPDYMHLVNLGLMKLIWELLLEGDAENKSKPHHIGKHKVLIEQRLQSIRLPSCFPRRIRSISEHAIFKASEWETLLFHCIYPCFNDLLPNKYMHHLMLLSSSIFQLLEFKISRITISSCEKKLDLFVKDFEKHYGTKNMVYNVHLTSHLAQTVRNLGALWNSSLYPYENGNSMLIGFQTSKNHPVLQVSQKFLLNRICRFGEVKNSLAKDWISKVWSPMHQKIEFSQHNLSILPDHVDVSTELKRVEFCDIGKYHYKGIRICSKDVCKNFKYDDSFIHVNGDFLNIDRLLIDKNKNAYVLGTILKTTKIFENMFMYELSNTQKLSSINNTLRLCVNVEIVMDGEPKDTLKYVSLCKSKTQID